MRSLKDLDTDALKVALDASDSLMKHKAYLPPGGLLVMLLGRWRDEVGDALGMERGELPTRGKERRSLDELTSVELGTVSGAVAILLQSRFTAVMDDPELPKQLREFDGNLSTQTTEREELKASIAS
jgi:hypothetical protein